MTETQPRASAGLARMERSIWPFNPGQAPDVRLALISQAPDTVQPTKHPKTISNEPWPGWAANQTHSMYAVSCYMVLYYVLYVLVEYP